MRRSSTHTWICFGLAMAVLALVAASCAQAEPIVSPESVEVVFSKVAAVPSGMPLTPLWEDEPEDREHILDLLRALGSARQVEAVDQESPMPRGRHVTIRYRDGSKTLIQTVAWCDEWAQRGFMCERGFKRLPDRFFVEGPGSEGRHIESSALRKWWDWMEENLEPVPWPYETGL